MTSRNEYIDEDKTIEAEDQKEWVRRMKAVRVTEIVNSNLLYI